MTAGERVYRLLLRAYPRDFRERYAEDLVAFFRADARHAKYGGGALRAVRFWSATLRDLARVAAVERARTVRRQHGHAALSLPIRSRHMPSLSSLLFDLRSAIRSLRSTPAVTLTALAVLTLAIGAGTAIFSVVDAVVLRDAGFDDEATLVAVNETDLRTGGAVTVAHQNFVEWAARQDVFTSLAASASSQPLVLTGGAHAERLKVVKITANLLDVLRVRPALGAGLSNDAPQSLLLSDAAWRRLFAADPRVVGRAVPCQTGTYYVAGVMPRDFVYPIGSTATSSVDAWIPYVPDPRNLVRTGGRNYFLRVVARLRPGVSAEQATVRMTQIRDVLAAEYPRWFEDRGVMVRPIKASIVSSEVRSWMLMLLAAVAGVLLVACANIANLLLARAAARSREIGVRAAMGATRTQLVRGAIVESVALAALGTLGGIAVAFWGAAVLRATLPDTLPRVWAIAVDLRVVAVAAAAALVTGVLAGLLPALQTSRADVSAVLRSGARGATAGVGRQRLRTAFLVVEVSLTAVLLVSAGMFVTSFVRLVRTDLGFRPERLVAVDVMPALPTDTRQIEPTLTRLSALMRDALDRIRAVPGVEGAALINGGLPLSRSYMTVPAVAAGRPDSAAEEVVLKQVTGDYLDLIGATLIAGRTVRDTDRAGTTPVVVLNDVAARRFFGIEQPLGAEIRLDNDPPRRVVGIVRATRSLGPETDLQPEAFVPFAQTNSHAIFGNFVVRANGDVPAALQAVKSVIWSTVPGVTVLEPETFEQMYGALIAQRKLNMILLAVFGALALLIAAIGIYGVIAYLVEQRTKEIGVRMALGAVPARILGMVLSRAAAAIGAGLAIGFLGALWLERVVVAFVYKGVRHDPIVYGAAAALLLGLGLFAAWVPARRAARVDPLVALRLE